MRILFIHTIGKTKFGGGERWVVNAAQGLSQSGHQVIVAGRKDSMLLLEAAEAGLETADFNIYSNISLYQAIKLALFIRRKKIDVVISKGRDVGVAGLGALWGRRALLIRRSGSPPSKRSLKHVMLTRWLTHGVITNTETIREFYLKKGFTASGFVKVLYNGLDLQDEATPHDFSLEYPGKTIGLCVGRLVAAKGYFYLIEALSEIRKTNHSILFYVLGDGKDKEALLAQARTKGVEDMIHFAGYRHQVAPYMKGCDFLLHPSLKEGMPNAAMEAMAYGKPVIMTNVDGAIELSQNGQYALLVPPADPAAIARAVSELLRNPETYRQKAYEAREHARSRFSMQNMTTELADYLELRLREHRENIKQKA